MEPVPGLFAGSPEHKPFTAVFVVVVVVVNGGFSSSSSSSSMFGRGNRLFYCSLAENIKHFERRVANE
jgi:hypothetical protein